MQHDVKTLPEYFQPVKDGIKKFELRCDDRHYSVGDTVHLEEWTPERGYTGRDIVKEITYVLRNCPQYGIATGYCIVGWR